MKKAYVSDNGIPRSVATVEKLPNRGFVGATVFCEGDQNLYVFTGDEYITVGSGEGGSGGGGAVSSGVTLQVIDKVASLPGDAAQGTLAYVDSTDAVYCKVGANWKKMAFTEDANV